MFEITKDTIIAEIVQNAPQCAEMFLSIGMHCMGCAFATGETVEQACAEYGVNVDEFVAKLNAAVAG
ncbi:MAG: DUF1858 domain-containing protein [Oscillospiraceae bacterium]|nr:DUF1858 domain-containing protein [Oscillospiraceae bacterium]MCD8017766.1 DUF1858 domain-containing protein [Oscillospiraceae bacterium]MCD8065850.1 DUF1858 domain-containing protein [Oscillospiraceae bacterium]MCD8374792.1 DUF1858 domain-containing protein [Oscillospiraceae bacterium]